MGLPFTDQTSEKESPDFETSLEHFADFYDDVEIVKYSMTRAIKNKISDEMSGNIDKAPKVEIEKDEENLVLKAFF